MSSPPVQLQLRERLSLVIAFARTLAVIVLAAITFLFRQSSNGGGGTLKIYLSRLMARTLFAVTTIRQQQSLFPASSAAAAYQTFAKQKGFEPHEVELSNGAKGFWIGNESAPDMLVWFVGGGYVVPLTPGHLEFCWQIIQNLSQHKKNLTILVIQYSLAPNVVYPHQLNQSIEAVRYLTTTLGKHPSNIILGGDSAGGTIALDIVAHAKHQHPAIAPLAPETPYKGLLLISPWADLHMNGGSCEQNSDKDICTPQTLKPWAEAYLAGVPSDNYSAPCQASAEWWRGLQAKKVLVTAGREECLVDSVKQISSKIGSSHPEIQLVVGNGECHVAPISSLNFGETHKGEQALAIDSWLLSNL